MKNLLLSSLFVISMSGCTLGHYHKLRPVLNLDTDAVNKISSIYNEHNKLLLFNTNIQLYGKSLTGLLVAKEISPEKFRVVLTAAIGAKLFDFEFCDSTTIIHYCLPQLQRTSLLKSIQDDIATILQVNAGQRDHVSFFEKNKEQVVHRRRYANQDCCFFLKNLPIKLPKLKMPKNRVLKRFIFNDSIWPNPTTVTIQHYDFKMKIELKKIIRLDTLVN